MTVANVKWNLIVFVGKHQNMCSTFSSTEMIFVWLFGCHINRWNFFLSGVDIFSCQVHKKLIRTCTCYDCCSTKFYIENKFCLLSNSPFFMVLLKNTCYGSDVMGKKDCSDSVCLNGWICLQKTCVWRWKHYPCGPWGNVSRGDVCHMRTPCLAWLNIFGSVLSFFQCFGEPCTAWSFHSIPL